MGRGEKMDFIADGVAKSRLRSHRLRAAHMAKLVRVRQLAFAASAIRTAIHQMAESGPQPFEEFAMKIRFSNLTRPKRTAKLLVDLVQGLKLSHAHEWTAALYGYDSWYQLSHETQRPTGPVSPDDEDVDLNTRDARWIFQTHTLEDLGGFDSRDAAELARSLGATSRGKPGAPSPHDVDDSKLLFPRAMHPALERAKEEHDALMRQDPQIRDKLAEQTADRLGTVRHTAGAEPFFAAIRRADIEAVRALLTQDRDLVHAVAETGSTPLIDACSAQSPEIVVELLRHKPNVNLADIEGFTPLHEASRRGLSQAVAPLLAAGAKHHFVTPHGWTPLLMSLCARFEPQTPEDYAEVVCALVDAGSDVRQTNNAGKSALDLIETNPFIAEAGRVKIQQAAGRVG